jgi:hypothetical protein
LMYAMEDWKNAYEVSVMDILAEKVIDGYTKAEVRGSFGVSDKVIEREVKRYRSKRACVNRNLKAAVDRYGRRMTEKFKRDFSGVVREWWFQYIALKMIESARKTNRGKEEKETGAQRCLEYEFCPIDVVKKCMWIMHAKGCKGCSKVCGIVKSHIKHGGECRNSKCLRCIDTGYRIALEIGSTSKRALGEFNKSLRVISSSQPFPEELRRAGQCITLDTRHGCYLSMESLSIGFINLNKRRKTALVSRADEAKVLGEASFDLSVVQEFERKVLGKQCSTSDTGSAVNGKNREKVEERLKRVKLEKRIKVESGKRVKRVEAMSKRPKKVKAEERLSKKKKKREIKGAADNGEGKKKRRRAEKVDTEAKEVKSERKVKDEKPKEGNPRREERAIKRNARYVMKGLDFKSVMLVLLMLVCCFGKTVREGETRERPLWSQKIMGVSGLSNGKSYISTSRYRAESSMGTKGAELFDGFFGADETEIVRREHWRIDGGEIVGYEALKVGKEGINNYFEKGTMSAVGQGRAWSKVVRTEGGMSEFFRDVVELEGAFDIFFVRADFEQTEGKQDSELTFCREGMEKGCNDCSEERSQSDSKFKWLELKDGERLKTIEKIYFDKIVGDENPYKENHLYGDEKIEKMIWTVKNESPHGIWNERVSVEIETHWRNTQKEEKQDRWVIIDTKEETTSHFLQDSKIQRTFSKEMSFLKAGLKECMKVVRAVAKLHMQKHKKKARMGHIKLDKEAETVISVEMFAIESNGDSLGSEKIFERVDKCLMCVKVEKPNVKENSKTDAKLLEKVADRILVILTRLDRTKFILVSGMLLVVLLWMRCIVGRRISDIEKARFQSL